MILLRLAEAMWGMGKVLATCEMEKRKKGGVQVLVSGRIVI
jgi:hypothetical protein